MTENISAAAATRRENARTSTGQFGTHPQAEAEIELSPDTHFSQEQIVAARQTYADADLAYEEAEAQRFIAGFRSLSDGRVSADPRSQTVAMVFGGADQHNRARLSQAFPGIRWAANEVSDEPQIYGPATVDDDDTQPPHWAAFRRGEGGYPAGSFTTNLMDLYDSEDTTDADRQAISKWWPHLAAELDKDS